MIRVGITPELRGRMRPPAAEFDAAPAQGGAS